MTSYEQLLAAVTQNPEDDGARLALATDLRSSDPDRATFIERQVEVGQSRRKRKLGAGTMKDGLLAKHEQEWTRTIAKYATAWTYDRGFVTSIEIEPNLFLEYGEWLLINAPIRHVRFSRPDGEMPVRGLAASPIVAKLDSITFAPDATLSDAELIALARGGHLTRLLRFVYNEKRALGPNVYESFAASPQTKKLLAFLVADDKAPMQSFGGTGQIDMHGNEISDWGDLPPVGQALEQAHGYIPWLHVEENNCEPFDARYFVEQGLLPKRPVGSRS